MLAKFLIFDNDISSLKEKKNECGKKVYQNFYYILFFIVLLFYYFVNLKKIYFYIQFIHVRIKNNDFYAIL